MPTDQTHQSLALAALFCELLAMLEHNGLMEPEDSDAVFDKALHRVGAFEKQQAFVALVANCMKQGRSKPAP